MTPEDLLLYKLIAWRPKDRGGIERLLVVQHELDRSYSNRWAKSFAVEERLRQCLRDAGLERS